MNNKVLFISQNFRPHRASPSPLHLIQWITANFPALKPCY